MVQEIGEGINWLLGLDADTLTVWQARSLFWLKRKLTHVLGGYLFVLAWHS